MKRDERGTGGIEGLAFGVLVFVFGLLVVVNAWGVIDAKWAASAAAREAGRAFVEASSNGAAQQAASAAAQATLSGRHHPLTSLQVIAPGFGRCGVAQVDITTSVPRLSLPMLGATGGTYRVRATHSEVIDPYRSGLTGTARCLPS